MTTEKNPFIEPEDYYKQYNKNIDALKNRPDVIELDKLCYELFEMNDMGKRFLQICTEKWVIPSLAHRDSAQYTNAVIWAEGFKEAFRFIMAGIKAHQQRIAAGS